MNAAMQKSVRAEHTVVSEIHKALAAADMSIADLARIIKESESFIRSILEGENGINRLINMRLLQEIADATGKIITVKIQPQRAAKHRRSVKTETPR